jgi:hypothetical protein
VVRRRDPLRQVTKPRPGAFLARLQKRINAAAETADTLRLQPGAPLSVEQHATKWITDRRPLNLATASDDETRLKKHALPTIGHLRLDEVRPRHIRGLVKTLRAEGKLAPRTIYRVFFTVAQMFK